jgi:hypothetical protein
MHRQPEEDQLGRNKLNRWPVSGPDIAGLFDVDGREGAAAGLRGMSGFLIARSTAE